MRSSTKKFFFFKGGTKIFLFWGGGLFVGGQLCVGEIL